jgi:hypothetical protein
MIDIAGVPPSLLRSLPHVLSILLAHTQRGGHVVSGCGNAVRLASSAAVSLAHSQHRCQGCYGCVHTYTWIYICVVVCMCIYIFISMCVNIYIYMYMHVSKHIFIYMNSLVHRLSHRNITKSKTDLTHTHTRAEFRCLRAHIMQMNLMWLLEAKCYSIKHCDKLIYPICDYHIENTAFIEEADQNAVCVAFVIWLLFEGLWGCNGFVGSLNI